MSSRALRCRGCLATSPGSGPAASAPAFLPAQAPPSRQPHIVGASDGQNPQQEQSKA